MMRVVKRNGDLEEVSFDKVLKRVKKLSEDLQGVNVVEIAQKVCGRIFDGVSTRELDEMTAQMCSSMIIDHPDYGTLAARIAISNHHKNTSPSFSETVKMLYGNLDAEGAPNPLVSSELMQVVEKHWGKLNSYIDYARDYMLDYFGFKTLEKSYLMRVNGRVVERPQHMWMRVAIGIHGHDLKDALLTYDLMSQKYFTHATPTLFNAGTPRPQCSSCYLHAINGDSVAGIFQSLSECAHISKYSGGIGMHIHDIRCKGSRIRGTNGVSDGIIPMLRVFNNTARYINQCFVPDTMVYTAGGIKRMDAVACGEMLLTHDGSFKPVHAISKKHVTQKQISVITTQAAALPVHVTPEHQVYVWKQGSMGPTYMSVDDIRAGDMVGHPVPVAGNPDGSCTMDDCTFYGTMLRCGYATPDEEGLTTPYFADIEFVERYLSEHNVVYRWREQDGTFKMQWSPSAETRCSLYGPNGTDKMMDAKFWDLPMDHTAALCNGLLDPNNALHTPYYALAAAARLMLAKIGFGCGVTMSAECTFSVVKDASAIMESGLVWTNVISITKRVYTGDVYDFNMVDNHNYTVVDLGLVHNSGKRNGSIAVYLEPWHGDIEQFLDLRKNHGNEEERCRDLFLALWIPDLFMERVEADAMWSLMCPDTCKGLSDAHGEDFKRLYEGYEAKGMFMKRVRAQELWFKMLESQIETGTPYMLFKDAANAKSNQKNLGTIKSSNLCVAGDTMILTSKGYTRIQDVKDTEVDVWNGEAWSTTMVRQTGEAQKLVRVTFSNGVRIRCTPYHKFYLEDQEGRPTEAKDLKPHDKLKPFRLPVVKGQNNKWCKSDNILDAYALGKCCVRVPMSGEFYYRLEWLEGFIDANGTWDDALGVVAHWHDEPALERVCLMLHTLGVSPVMDRSTQSLVLGDDCIKTLVEAGFECDLLDGVGWTHEGRGVDAIRVTLVQEEDAPGDTFCFNEPLRHMGVFNGILAGNCIEIIQYSSPEETAVCNLASIGLPMFVNAGVFDFHKLHAVVKVITKNLNKVIDKNFYPVEKSRRSNMLHRPIGIGVQGLADTFATLRMPFESEQSRALNKDIFETIYFAALEASMEIAKRRHEAFAEGGQDALLLNEYERESMLKGFEAVPKYPGAYATFEGSPVSEGILQFDMWGVVPDGSRHDWAGLKAQIKKYGVRNSLLVAPMPTASTAQILGNNESFEPFTSNVFKRKTMSGEFIVVNKYLLGDLIKQGLWNNRMKELLILHNGSVQGIGEVPDDIKELYKTVWEIKQKAVIDMAAQRGAYIDQSQSMNLFVEDPDYKKLTSMHFYSWRQGLKCGLYYLRTRPRATTQQFTIDPTLSAAKRMKCTEEVCTMCSS